ncbi:MAG: type IV pili methyl-accepting chemotaxis transducer N-terminal domain-containing protein [Pseudomonadota bacterium]
MTTSISKTFALLTGLTMAGVGAQPAMAGNVRSGPISAEEALDRINLTGRQRSLSQRIARAACYISEGIETAAKFDELVGAYDLFVATEDGLRNGDPALGLQAEQFRRVIKALDRIEAPWTTYSTIVSGVMEEAAVEPALLEPLDAASLEVLTFMNIAVSTTARAYGSVTPQIPLSEAITLDIAGRQRTLIMKSVKEACLVRALGPSAERQETLVTTIQNFDLSLSKLKTGFEGLGLTPPPSMEAARQLDVVTDLWQDVKPILDQAATGVRLSDLELSRLSRLSNQLYREMNVAVDLYREADLQS